MASRFDNEFRFYLERQDEFVKDHNGEWVVIKGNKVLGFYDDQLQAIQETQKDHKLGTFMVSTLHRARPNIHEHFIAV